jgi:hypothetical protein
VSSPLVSLWIGRATPAEDNYWFLQMINNSGIAVHDVGATIAEGRMICFNIGNGSSGTIEADRLYYARPPCTYENASDHLLAAVVSFCP